MVFSANTKVGKIPGGVHEVCFKCYEGSQIKTDFLVTLECMGWILLDRKLIDMDIIKFQDTGALVCH